MKKIVLGVICLLTCTSLANAQFGKFKERLKQQLESLKEATEQEKSDEGVEVEQEEEGGLAMKIFKEEQRKQLVKDTTYHNFSFAQAEKIAFFTSRDDDQSAVYAFTKYYDDTNFLKPPPKGYEQAFDFNRAGGNSMAINRILATFNFTEALKIYFGESNVDSILWASAKVNLKNLMSEQTKDTLTINDYYAIGKTINNIAIMYHTSGLFTLSQELNLSLVDFIDENIGSESLLMASTYNNIGLLESSMGNYDLAEEYMDKSSKILLRRKDDLNLDLAVLYNNQAMLYQQMGQYNNAITKIDAALQVAGNKINNKGADYSKLLLNKALILKSQKKYDRSEELLLQLKKTKEKRFGTRHQDYADIQSMLASLYMEMGQTDKVEPLLLNALDIYGKKFNQEHPTYTSTLQSLGLYYLYTDRFVKSRESLRKAKELIVSTFGTNHPDYLDVSESLAILAWNEGDIPQAQIDLIAVCNEKLSLVEKFFPAMSENEKSKFWGKNKHTFLKFFAFVAANHEEYPAMLTEMYNIQLATKGILLNATSKVRQLILNSSDEELKKYYTHWINTKEQLANAYSLSKSQIQEQKINVDSLEQRANDLEKSLSKRSAEFANAGGLRSTKAEDVAEKLAPGEVAIEIVRFPAFAKSFSSEINYAYLILDHEGNIHMALQKNGQELETKYASRYRKSIQYKIEDEQSYGVYWGLLTDQLAGKERVYLSVDGIYNQLNVNTLKKPTGEYLADELHIVNLASTRDVGRVDRSGGVTARLLMFGNPDFGKSTKVAELPGTREEIEKIAKIAREKSVKVSTYLGKEANEALFKEQVKNPEVLHVATHGFFLTDVESDEGVVFGVEITKAKENPLLRSGLMLAGAEKMIDNVESKEVNSANNGILTAYEVMNLDLKDTQLVVLSACETGLGEVRSGEGVYGLQRAFQLAGAETVIMSLWKVNDEATQQLMTTFYQEWVASGDKFKAFQQAQKAMQQTYKNPYYWGAFVMMN